MKILKWIRKYIDKVRSRFRKRKREREIFIHIGDSKNNSLSEIESKIEEFATSSGNVTEKDIKELVEEQTEIELQTILESDLVKTKTRKRVFDIVEVEQEIGKLNRKLYDIKVKQKQIEPVRFPQNYSTDKNIEELESVLLKHDNKQNLKFPTSSFDKIKALWQKIEKFAEEHNLTKSFQKREAERVKEFKKLKLNIENLQIQANKEIEQSDFSSAKVSIRNLETLLKSIQTLSLKIVQGKAKENKRVVSNFLGKTLELRRKLENKETQIESKRQAEELKKQQDEAERRKLAEEAKREEQQKQREQQELLQRQKAEARRKKEEEKKEELQRLFTKKSNWQNFAEILRENNIYKFYHFTDRANLKSIREKGGLFSWHYCDNHDVFIPKTGGDTLSRDLDKSHKLHDYVRLSFCDDHPMQFRLSQSGYNLVILEVKIDVAFFENTRFSDINAADKKHNQGASLEDLKRVKFTATKRNYVRKEDPDFKFHQAEIMVKTWIPIEYITNINQF